MGDAGSQIGVGDADEEQVQRVLEALSAGDAAAFGRLVTEDVEIRTDRRTHRGRDAAIAWAANEYDHLRRRFAVDRLEQGEGETVVRGRTEYVWKDGGALADSSPVTIGMRFEEGLLARWRYL